MDVSAWRGQWWLPGSSDRRVGGVLEWDGVGLPRLTLDSQLEPVDIHQMFAGRHDYDAIHGQLGEAFDNTRMGGLSQITCFGCVLSGISHSALGDGQRFLMLKGVLVGIWCSSLEDAAFIRYEVEYEHLESWYPWTGIVTEPSSDGRAIEYRVTYSQPPQAFSVTTSEARLSILSVPMLHPTPRSQKITETLYMEIVHSEGRAPWTVEYEHIAFVRELLCVATLHFVSIREIRIVTVDSNDNLRLCRWLSRRLPPASTASTDESERPLLRAQMLFTAVDCPDERRSAIFEAWFGAAGRYSLAVDILIQDIRDPRAALDVRLLLLARALEALSRQKHLIADSRLAHHRTRMEALQTLVEPRNRKLWKWVRGRLSRAYEPSFQERLEELIQDVGSAVEAIIPRGFASEFARHRNAYTHEDPGRADPPVPVDTDVLAQQGRWLLTAVLLVEIGFTETEIRSFLEANSEGSVLARRVSVSSSSRGT